MRAAAAILACALLAGCGSATVLERSPERIVLRWDENSTSPQRVANQAIDLCSQRGFEARRAVAVSDDVEGSLHVTSYACQPWATGPWPRVL